MNLNEQINSINNNNKTKKNKEQKRRRRRTFHLRRCVFYHYQHMMSSLVSAWLAFRFKYKINRVAI
jgi:hypothetical protein